MSPAAAPLVRAHVRRQVKTLIITIIVALAFGAGAVVLGVNTLEAALRDYETVEVTATGERVESRTVGSRRTRHVEEYRVVEVTLPDGSHGTVESDAIQVGDTVTVFRSTDEGVLYETEPDGPGVVEWLLFAGAILACLVALAVTLVPIGEMKAVRNLRRPDLPTLVLDLTGVAKTAVNAKDDHHFTTVVRESTVPYVAPGTTVTLVARARHVPQNLAPRLRAIAASAPGPEQGLNLAVASDGTADWWMATGKTPETLSLS